MVVIVPLTSINLQKIILRNPQFGNTLIDPISYADPNVHVILKLLLTLPVGSCTCERSFSPLRRLKIICVKIKKGIYLNNKQIRSYLCDQNSDEIVFKKNRYEFSSAFILIKVF
jgi:hypothetical protein